MLKTDSNIILGVDPGSRLCGWGLVRQKGLKVEFIAAGTIDLRKLTEDTDKLIMIYDELNQIISDSDPNLAAIESPFYHKNPQTLIKLTQARASAIIAIKKRDLPLTEFSPLEVKKTLTGRGRADKSQVAFMVSKTLDTSLDHLNDDATDALAIAICRCYRNLGSQANNKVKSKSNWADFIKENPERLRQG